MKRGESHKGFIARERNALFYEGMQPARLVRRAGCITTTPRAKLNPSACDTPPLSFVSGGAIGAAFGGIGAVPGAAIGSMVGCLLGGVTAGVGASTVAEVVVERLR